MDGRGHADAEIQQFVEVGYRHEQVLEVLVGITLKTLSSVIEAPGALSASPA